MKLPHLIPGQMRLVADEFNFAFAELERIRNFVTDLEGSFYIGGMATAFRRWPRMLPEAAPPAQRLRLFRVTAYRDDLRPFWPQPMPVAFEGIEVDAIGGNVIGQDVEVLHAFRWPFEDLAGIEIPMTRYVPQLPFGATDGLSDVPVFQLLIDPGAVRLYSWEQEADPPVTSRLYIRGLFVGYCI